MATQLDAVKRATVGLIGDGQKTITASKLYRRVQDQCNRLGCYTPSWSKYVDLLRQINCKLSKNSKGRIIVHLPSKR